MNDILDKIANKQKALDEKSSTLKKIIEKYPDLKDDGATRWRKGLLVSYLATGDMNDVDFCHSCGCCSDSPLYAEPYTTFLGYKIYHPLVQFYIGYKNEYGYGEVEIEWREDFDKLYCFNKTIYNKIEKYFEDNPVGYYEDDE